MMPAGLVNQTLKSWKLFYEPHQSMLFVKTREATHHLIMQEKDIGNNGLNFSMKGKGFLPYKNKNKKSAKQGKKFL